MMHDFMCTCRSSRNTSSFVHTLTLGLNVIVKRLGISCIMTSSVCLEMFRHRHDDSVNPVLFHSVFVKVENPDKCKTDILVGLQAELEGLKTRTLIVIEKPGAVVIP